MKELPTLLADLDFKPVDGKQSGILLVITLFLASSGNKAVRTTPWACRAAFGFYGSRCVSTDLLHTLFFGGCKG